WLLLRQRNPCAHGVSTTVWYRVASGTQLGLAGIHGRWWLPHADAVDVRWLGLRAGKRLGVATALARARRRMVANGSGRIGATGSRCTGASRELVRGRRLRALG